MIPNKKNIKNVKMTKSRKMWNGKVEETRDPFQSPKKTESLYTVSYKLPVAFEYIDSISKDGKVIWENEIGAHVQTGALGGGGRFWLSRKWFRGELVEVRIEFRDLTFTSAAEPDLIVSIRI